jgi:hypothetical protein
VGGFGSRPDLLKQVFARASNYWIWVMERLYFQRKRTGKKREEEEEKFQICCQSWKRGDAITKKVFVVDARLGNLETMVLLNRLGFGSLFW